MTSQEVKGKQEGEEQHPVAAWGRWGEAGRGLLLRMEEEGEGGREGRKLLIWADELGFPSWSAACGFFSPLCPAKGQLEMS